MYTLGFESIFRPSDVKETSVAYEVSHPIHVAQRGHLETDLNVTCHIASHGRRIAYALP